VEFGSIVDVDTTRIALFVPLGASDDDAMDVEAVRMLLFEKVVVLVLVIVDVTRMIVCDRMYAPIADSIRVVIAGVINACPKILMGEVTMVAMFRVTARAPCVIRTVATPDTFAMITPKVASSDANWITCVALATIPLMYMSSRATLMDAKTFFPRRRDSTEFFGPSNRLVNTTTTWEIGTASANASAPRISVSSAVSGKPKYGISIVIDCKVLTTEITFSKAVALISVDSWKFWTLSSVAKERKKAVGSSIKN